MAHSGKFGASLEDQQAVVSRHHDAADTGERNRLNHNIDLHHFDLHVQGAQLLTNASLKLVAGRRYGLVGDNGVGKSTLLRHIAGRKIQGMWKRHMTVAYVGEEEEEAANAETAGSLTVEQFMSRRQAGVGDDDEFNGDDDAASDDSARNASIDIDPAHIAECCRMLSGLGLRIVNKLSSQTQNVAPEGSGGTTTITGTNSGRPDKHITTATPMADLSGGQRMLVALATALVHRPNLLLLDEPSNHLDVEGVIWLCEALARYPGTVLVASHDLDLLNDVATDIAVISPFHKSITQYAGNYDGYRRAALETMAQRANQAQWETSKRKQIEGEIEHLERKIGTKTAGDRKAGSMISSRKKALDRLGAQRTATGRRFKLSYHGKRISVADELEAEGAAHPEPFSFNFRTDKRVQELADDAPLVELVDVSFRYARAAAAAVEPAANEDTFKLSGVNKWGRKKATGHAAAPSPPPSADASWLLHNVNLSVCPRQKIGLVGRNGSGKSTLLKLIAGEVAPGAGTRATPALDPLRLGHYGQGLVMRLDTDVSAFEYVSTRHPGATAEQVYNQLGSFGIPPHRAEGVPMGCLSAGQRVRVTFACESFKRPSLLLLDEPTNHLDVEAQVALIDALQNPKLTCIVVSHSEAVLSCCDHIYVVENNAVALLKGGFADYKERVLQGMDGIPDELGGDNDGNAGTGAGWTALPASDAWRAERKDTPEKKEGDEMVETAASATAPATADAPAAPDAAPGAQPDPQKYRAVSAGASELMKDRAAVEGGGGAAAGGGGGKWVSASARRRQLEIATGAEGKKEDEGKKEGTGGGAKPAGSGVKCRVCGGPHFSSSCDRKKELDRLYEEREKKRQAKRDEEERKRQELIAAAGSLPDDGQGEWSMAAMKKGKKGRPVGKGTLM